MKRDMTWIVLMSICFSLLGCSRHIFLERPDRSVVGLPYECGEKKCKVDKNMGNATDDTRSGTTYHRTLPTDCGSNGIAKIRISNAGSRNPQVIAYCAAPSQDGGIPTMGNQQRGE